MPECTSTLNTGAAGRRVREAVIAAHETAADFSVLLKTAFQPDEMALPSTIAQANEALRQVGELRNHKGREGNAWWHTKAGAYLPDASIPGNTDARDAVGLLNQSKGGAFLEAFKALKGGGQITEIEGKKATDAIARMDRSQSKAEFDKALTDYEGVIRLGIDRANQLAGKPAPNEFRGNAVKGGSYTWTPGGGLRPHQ